MSLRYECDCPHGYTRYTHGCRCQKCREAKAAYMAARRSAAYRDDHQVPEGITHGTRFAYEEHGCRCEACVATQADGSSRGGTRKKATAA